jgi:single-strand DNA-binding protein
MNKFLFMGRLTRDPELRYTPNGHAVCEVGLALNHRYRTSAGEDREETTFVEVVFWRKMAEVVCQYFKKGKLMAGCGRLKQESWTDQQGSKRSKLKVEASEFHFCGDKDPAPDQAPAATPASVPTTQHPSPLTGGPLPPVPEKDIPF